MINNKDNNNINQFVDELHKFIMERLNDELLIKYQNVAGLFNFNNEKELLDSLLLDMKDVLTDAENTNLNEFEKIDFSPVIINITSKLKKRTNIIIDDKDEIVLDVLHNIFNQYFAFVLFQIQKENGTNQDGNQFIDILKLNTKRQLEIISILQNQPVPDINIINDIFANAEILANAILPVKTSKISVTKNENSLINKKYFIWKKDEYQLKILFDILTNGIDPYIEGNYEKFKSIFIVENIAGEESTKVKWLRPLNTRQVALLFHQLCDNDWIDKRQTRVINSIISDRLLDSEGKSISKDNLKKSFSGFKNIKRKSPDILEIESIIAIILQSNK